MFFKIWPFCINTTLSALYQSSYGSWKTEIAMLLRHLDGLNAPETIFSQAPVDPRKKIDWSQIWAVRWLTLPCPRCVWSMPPSQLVTSDLNHCWEHPKIGGYFSDSTNPNPQTFELFCIKFIFHCLFNLDKVPEQPRGCQLPGYVWRLAAMYWCRRVLFCKILTHWTDPVYTICKLRLRKISEVFNQFFINILIKISILSNILD